MKKSMLFLLALMAVGCASKQDSPTQPVAATPTGKGGYLVIINQGSCSNGFLSGSVTVGGMQITGLNIPDGLNAAYLAPANTTLSYSINGYTESCSGGTTVLYGAAVTQGTIALNGVADVFLNANGVGGSVSIFNGTY